MARDSSAKADINDKTTPRRKGHTGLYIRLGILAVIVIGVIYFYYAFLSGGVLSLALGAAQNPSSLEPAIMSKISSYPQLNISYSGSVSQGSDPALTVSFEKFYNDYAIFISVPNLTTGSMYKITVLSEGNNSLTYYCSGYSNAEQACNESSGTPSQAAEHIASSLGITGLQNAKITGVPTPTYYDGKPCFAVSGSDVLHNANGLLVDAGSANVVFSGCMSAKYYVPLYLNATITPATGPVTHLYMHASSIVPYSSNIVAATLPGIINSTT